MARHTPLTPLTTPTPLGLSRRPAVILIHSFIWFRMDYRVGTFWPSSERDFHEFAMYYGLPELSVKASAWRLMQEGEQQACT